MTPFLTPLVLAAFAAAQADPKAEMMAADRDFAKVTAAKGLDGWVGTMADDAAKSQRIGEKLVIGKEAIRQADAGLFADPKVKLTWEPTEAHAFADGKTGLTVGKYKVVAKTADGKEEVRGTGSYVTWWRKDPDGWKVIFDTGTPDVKK